MPYDPHNETAYPSQDWPGDYECHCTECGATFQGRKWQQICDDCIAELPIEVECVLCAANETDGSTVLRKEIAWIDRAGTEPQYYCYTCHYEECHYEVSHKKLIH